MAIIRNPILFSEHFGLSSRDLENAGLIDPFLNVDTPLFIDPLLIPKSSIPVISNDALAHFRNHFSGVVRLLTISQKEGDTPWKAAQRLLSLKEPPENGLGYGTGERSGTSRPEELRETILRTMKEIVTLGAKDPEMISLMGLFEENVGPDTISDLTTRVISAQLVQLTTSFCSAHGVPTKPVKLSLGDDDVLLPHYKGINGSERAIVLVPRDIIRDLPMANDWSDVQAAIDANRAIRDKVNQFLSTIIRPTVTERKEALRRAALSSPDFMNALLQTLKEVASHYDPNKDTLGYYKLKELLHANLDELRVDLAFKLEDGPENVLKVVHKTLEHFKHHVEHGNLWEALWEGDKPKKERAAQLIYYAIADTFCEANDLDISPEANMGGGPIDFKFSKGFHARVLVEMKRSSGTVVHGYEKQLEFYQNASRTNYAVFVVLDFGDLSDKLEQIMKIRNRRIAAGERASDIVVIDARKKTSASKRH
ncbi:chromosomal replication initiator DnaA [Neorhizobium petrolearium]|uniref:chromosomal replication initiator DnaA n=1 Tax=Neorhizobium petrolearium TaxID=515361 RepID=UPI003F7F9409